MVMRGRALLLPVSAGVLVVRLHAGFGVAGVQQRVDNGISPGLALR